MQKINSKENSLIKHIKKLKTKKYRDEYGEYIIEGRKIVEEALSQNVKIKQIVISENFDFENKKFPENTVIVSNEIFKIISDVDTPQGILAIIQKNRENCEILDEEFVIALDGIQDPGNLGTIIRTADSANIKKILVSKDTVDCYSLKVIRSTMGAIFRVQVIECENLKVTLENLKNKGYNIIVTELGAKQTIYDVKYNKSIVVVGNEGNGVSTEVKNIATNKVIIPMLGKTESLNVSVATSIVIYEYVRQKLI